MPTIHRALLILTAVVTLAVPGPSAQSRQENDKAATDATRLKGLTLIT